MGLISRVSSRTYRFCQKYTMGDQEEEIIDLHSMKVVELKAGLKQRKLPVSGTKAELIDRLEKYMTEHEGVEAVDEDELDKPVEKVDKPKEVVAENKADSPKALTYDEIPLCLKPFSWEDFAAMHKMLLNGMHHLPHGKIQEIYQRFPLALDAFHNDGDEIHFAPSTFPPVLENEFFVPEVKFTNHYDFPELT